MNKKNQLQEYSSTVRDVGNIAFGAADGNHRQNRRAGSFPSERTAPQNDVAELDQRPFTKGRETVSETVIRTEDGTIAMANVFEVDPDKQKELAEVMSEGAEKFIRHRPGCISVNILLSTDGKRLLYFAQWKSKGDIKATMADPDVQYYRDKAAELAKPDPHAYTVYSVHHPED
jgi:quinol monooxygenase YgiN